MGSSTSAAGGSDFVAEYDKASQAAPAAGCATPQARRRRWRSMDGQLVVGGHFYYGRRREETVAVRGARGRRQGNPMLDPNGECQTEAGHSRLLLRGHLDPDWHPAYSGSYSLVWALHVEGARLHTGGEFKKVSGVTQNSYARLSPASYQGQ